MASTAAVSPGSPIRGAIRVTVTNSTENVIAGEQFSIFVTVQNPFEVPLTVHRVSTHLPVEFYDVDHRNRLSILAAMEEQRAELEEAARSLGLPSEPTLRRPPSPLSRLFGPLRRLRILGFELEFDAQIGPAVARDLAPGTTTLEAGFSVPLLGTYTVTRQLKHEGPAEENREAVARQIEEERKRFQRNMESLTRPDSAALELQPGNSTTRLFTLRSGQAVWFKPASYRLRIEIEYEIGGQRNTDTVEHVLQVKASLTSMILGSLLGSAAGYLARSGVFVLDVPHVLGLATTLILAAMTVVLFARKKDVQPIIAVEDFWGGVAIGFLAAYAGHRLLSGLLPSST